MLLTSAVRFVGMHVADTGPWMPAAVQDLLPPYLDALITKLLGLLQNGQKLVQEGALTALASVADCAKEAFVKYYDQVCR